ncbi:MAG TPA: hypothetical protein VKR23_11355 [Gaiellaceae bacterium]|nr:hypothetical protein [Gaiellaceae bacterium]
MSSIGQAATRPPATTEPAEPLETTTVVAALQAESAPVLPENARRWTSASQIVALGALAAVVTAATVAASVVHDGVVRDLTAGVAALGAVGVLGGLSIAFRRPRGGTPAGPVAPVARKQKRFSTSKPILVLMMLIGVVAYFGGAGTFAGFTAQTTNANSTLGSGSLLMQNTVNANPVCESKLGESNNNVNANCTALFSFSNQEPGVYSGVSTVTIKNSGTLPASTMYLWAPYANGVLSTSISSGSSVTSLSLYASGHGPAGLEGTVNSGDHILVTYGGNSQTFVASAGASPGATTINVNALTATATFSAGATVEDLDSDTSAANTDCYDTQLVNLGFNPTTNNPLCSGTVLFVQEITGGFNYCWWGSGAGSANGQCDAPISTNPSSVSGGIVAAGSYTVTALTGNIKNGDTLQFTQGANKVTCPASSDYFYGATSVTVGACTLVSGANSGFNSSAVITDTSSLSRIASDTTHNISKFDQTAKYSGKIELTPVSANGTTAATGTDLASNATRTFVVGVVIAGSSAAPPANSQNQLQQLKSTFGLVWHIDQ